MTIEPVELAELEAAREALITAMVAEMPKAHRHFLVGFKKGTPEWDLLGIPGADKLPAVLWKRQNLDRLPDGKRNELIAALENVLLA